MAGPTNPNQHKWHDSFTGTEPTPPGVYTQPTPAKTINAGDSKHGPKKGVTAPDTYFE